jgi:hypothetical protein
MIRKLALLTNNRDRDGVGKKMVSDPYRSQI